jgi:hypothetical protein
LGRDLRDRFAKMFRQSEIVSENEIEYFSHAYIFDN